MSPSPRPEPAPVLYGLRHRPTRKLLRVAPEEDGRARLTLCAGSPLFVAESPEQLSRLLAAEPEPAMRDTARPGWGGMTREELEPVRLELVCEPAAVEKLSLLEPGWAVDLRPEQVAELIPEVPDPDGVFIGAYLPRNPADPTLRALIGQKVLIGAERLERRVLDVVPYLDAGTMQNGALVICWC